MIGLALQGGNYALFPTLLRRWALLPDPTVRSALVARVLERARSEPGVHRSNIGVAWHSSEDLFTENAVDWALPELAGRIREAVRAYLATDLVPAGTPPSRPRREVGPPPPPSTTPRRGAHRPGAGPVRPG